MRTFIIISVLALAIVMSAAQRRRVNRGSGRGAVSTGVQGGAAEASSLKAEDRQLTAEELLLQKKQARRARLDRKAARKERKRARAAKEEAARLKAANSVDYETFENKANFNNLDAAAKKESSDKFGLQLFSDNQNKEQAALSKSSGNKFETGTRFAQDDFIDAAAFDNREEIAEHDFFDGEELSAANEEQDLLNAKEAARQENEQFINAQSSFQANKIAEDRGIFGRNDFFDDSISSFGGFNSPFGK